ncbi:MAG: hypothetical protein EAZ91_24440 [Cytophagales bacterium]|nr:MAG: hypothetical protein EAZ91_24440 [Cytophagales bacterium]
MSAIETKSAIHKLVEEVNDEQLLRMVHAILEQKSVPETDFWDQLTQYQKAAIKQGIADADNSRTKPYRQVLSKYQ